MTKRTQHIEKSVEPVTLKAVSEYVGLAVGTISAILNQAPQSVAIPQTTKDRVFAAARKLRYQPNLFARALRTRTIPAASNTFATGSRALVFEGSEDFRRAVDAIRQAGLRVPGDVAIVGPGDFPAVSFERFPTGA